MPKRKKHVKTNVKTKMKNQRNHAVHGRVRVLALQKFLVMMLSFQPKLKSTVWKRLTYQRMMQLRALMLKLFQMYLLLKQRLLLNLWLKKPRLRTRLRKNQLLKRLKILRWVAKLMTLRLKNPKVLMHLPKMTVSNLLQMKTTVMTFVLFANRVHAVTKSKKLLKFAKFC